MPFSFSTISRPRPLLPRHSNKSTRHPTQCFHRQPQRPLVERVPHLLQPWRSKDRGKKTKTSIELDALPRSLTPRSTTSLPPVDISLEKTKRGGATSSLVGEALPQGLPESELIPDEDTGTTICSPKTRKSKVRLLPPEKLSADSIVEEDAPSAKSSVRKGKILVRDQELPQGLIPLEPLTFEHDIPTYPPVIAQARSNMLKYENCVLLTRVGGFYELYFEHAEQYGPLLNLKVAVKRANDKRPNAAPIYMAGFPFFQLDRYLKILVQDLNKYVAIAEEYPNDVVAKSKAGGLLHDRKVARIVTPGTLIDETFMDPFVNNYVLSIHVGETPPAFEEEAVELPFIESASSPIGLAWLDLSTGHFFTQATVKSSVPSLLARIAPREIVLDRALQGSRRHGFVSLLADDQHLVTYSVTSDVKPMSAWAHMLESPLSPEAEAEFTQQEVAAGSALLDYVENRLQGSNVKLQPPIRQLDMMSIDKNTMRALEIKRTTREDSFAGSVLHSIRRTVTKGGARLLDSRLNSPSTSLMVINSRLDLVTYMLNNAEIRDRMVSLLKRSYDCHRLLQKFAFGRGDADDLLALAATIYATQDIVTCLLQRLDPEFGVLALVSRIDLEGPIDLASRIRHTIDEDGLELQHQIDNAEAGEVQALVQAITDGESADDLPSFSTPKAKKKPTSIREFYSEDNEVWIMKPAASKTLSRLHDDLTSLSADKITLAETLSKELSLSTLTLRFTPGLGHICHIRGRDAVSPIPSIKSLSSSKSTRSFQHPSWSSLGARIDQTKALLRSEETRIFTSLRTSALRILTPLRRNAAVLDELDVACSFASLAAEKYWTRPVLNMSIAHKIIGGRHLTVEGGLNSEGRSFVSNDCFVGSPKPIWLITGPNMAGKSTFLRQNALITILAQVGSYVPAEFAELGIVDQIFSRVGSADNLYRDQSTFMVEMLESAAILKSATRRSFVIMDEIGRGTTPDDGTAVAFACLHHLYHTNKCRTLFATHFHEIERLIKSGGMEGVGYWCTDVEEDAAGGFRYLRKLRKGVNRRSHALKVARLAGMPEDAVRVAEAVLRKKAT